MRIAIIGAGNVGAALGTGWTRAGHSVAFGVRDPSAAKLKPLLDATGATALASVDALPGADVVVLALPWPAAEEAVKALGDLSGRIVIDCMNPLAMKDGILDLDRGYTGSGAETLAGWLPGARVVKAMNQVGAEAMADASGFPSRPVMFVAGDDGEAKAAVRSLVEDLGFEALDAGPLRQARILEPFAMVWIDQAIHRGLGRDWAFGVLRR